MILDVGCGGGEGSGDCVFFQLKGGNVVHVDLDRGAKHLEVRADTHVLPFKDKSFSVVYASHILEHLEYPTKALREWKRIARKKVIIHVPNVVSHYGTECGAHVYSWNVWTLKNLCRLVFSRVEVKGTTRFFIEHHDRFIKKFLVFWVTLPLRFRPNQLTAECIP